MADKKWQTFAPLPARVIADDALAALDIRVLACLAAHDRFGANGIGCYASHLRLAGLVRCHLKSLSRSLRVLADLGYIEASQHPLNKRLRVYRVIYLAADLAVMKSRIGNESVTEEDPIGNQHFQESAQYQSDADLNILGEALSKAGKAVKINSPEGASPYGAAEDLPRTNGTEPTRQDSDGQFLGRVQTWLMQHSPHLLNDAELAKITEARDECQRIVDEDEGSQGGIGGWAQRLAIELDGFIENGTDQWGAAVIGGRK